MILIANKIRYFFQVENPLSINDRLVRQLKVKVGLLLIFSSLLVKQPLGEKLFVIRRRHEVAEVSKSSGLRSLFEHGTRFYR